MKFEDADELNSTIRSICINHRARAAAVLRKLGLHPGHEAILFSLANSGPQSHAALADAAGCEPPTITSMVQKLETLGWIVRAPSIDDKRSIVVSLSAYGERRLSELEEAWVELGEQTVGEAGEQEIAAMLTALSALATRLQRHS